MNFGEIFGLCKYKIIDDMNESMKYSWWICKYKIIDNI